MANLKFTNSKGTSLRSVAAFVMYAMTAMAQNATDVCRPAPVIRVKKTEPAIDAQEANRTIK